MSIDTMFTNICKRQQRLQQQPDKASCGGKMQKTSHVKSVSFKDTVKVRMTISLESYSREEIEATWYTKAERSEILRQCNKEVDKLNRGKTLKNKKYCARGLERFVTEEAYARAERKARAVESVLSLQYQHSPMDGDWYLIAQFYHEITRCSRTLAYEAALQDEQAAEKYLLAAR